MSDKNVESIYPLSSMQEVLLFQTLSAPESGEYVVQLALTIEGEFRIPEFRRAWDVVVGRHPVLRTGFVWERLRQPVQVVRRRVTIPWREVDWRGQSAAQQQQNLGSVIRSERGEGFNLSVAPLMRLIVARTGGASHEVIWIFHHVILDGWSSAVVLREVLQAYMALCRGTTPDFDPPRPYRDFVSYVQRFRSPDSEAEAYWREELAGFRAPTLIGVGGTQGGSDQAEGSAEEESLLPEEATTALISFARESRLTVNNIVRGAWALLLSRYSGSEDVLFGVTMSGRPAALEGVEGMVGLFINTLPLRVHVAPDTPQSTWLARLQDRQADLLQHEQVPLANVLGWSQVPRGTPLFESLLVFENYPIDGSVAEGDGHLVSRARSFESAHYPLMLEVVPGRRLRLKLMYDHHRFARDEVSRILAHLQLVLCSMKAKPDQRLSDIARVTEGERAAMAGWNDTARAYPLDRRLHELIEEQVERTPEAVAVQAEEGRLTYGELDARANQLARHLRRLGVGPEVLVGVAMERSLEMVVALLGILKAGGAYVPLDPTYPPERVSFMMADAQVPVLLTQEHLLAELPASRARVLALDSGWAEVGEESAQRLEPVGTSENLAYMIYTSGSTGRPKGAMNAHRGIVNRLLWMQEAYGLGADDVVLQKTPFSFDVSVWEFFWPLLAGARLVMARPEGHKDPSYLVRTIVDEGVTTIHFVPPMLQAFLEEPGLERCVSLRRVVCSGEALPAELCARFHERLGCELHNLYGPTEAAVDVTYFHCRADDPRPRVPIGRPVANTRVYVLDPGLEPVPIGVAGELHLGGVQVGRGYLGRPELTAERFVPDPFGGEGGRLYRTGDLARLLPDGNVEYLGRLDHQVKIRGFRIELGEIEAAIARHPAVREAVVLAREDRPGDRRLVAYVTAPGAASPIEDALRSRVRAELPDYMVPSAIVLLDALLLSPNGKVDRKALATLTRDAGTQRTAFTAPRTATERTVARIWGETLSLAAPLSVDDNFFDLGGHSLSAARMIAALRSTLGIDVGLRSLFERPTVSGLSERVDLLRLSRDQVKADTATDESEEFEF